MLEFGYIGLSVLMSLIIIFGYRNALIKDANQTKKQNKKLGILIFSLVSWFGYLFILSSQEILFDLSFPPKIPILIFIPIIIATIIFYFKNKNKTILQHIPKSYPVYYQTFRIFVEIILLFTFYKNIIPKAATFEGLNFDIIMGISAPFMGYFVFQKQIKYPFLAKAWNILGILMVLFVFFIIATGFYQPQLWNSETPTVSMEFIQLPYLLIAGFLAPSAIFMHILSLMQLRK